MFEVEKELGPLKVDLYELDAGSYCLRLFFGEKQLFAIEGWPNEETDFRFGVEAIGTDSLCFDIGRFVIKWDLPRVPKLRAFLRGRVK